MHVSSFPELVCALCLSELLHSWTSPATWLSLFKWHFLEAMQFHVLTCQKSMTFGMVHVVTTSPPGCTTSATRVCEGQATPWLVPYPARVAAAIPAAPLPTPSSATLPIHSPAPLPTHPATNVGLQYGMTYQQHHSTWQLHSAPMLPLMLVCSMGCHPDSTTPPGSSTPHPPGSTIPHSRPHYCASTDRSRTPAAATRPHRLSTRANVCYGLPHALCCVSCGMPWPYILSAHSHLLFTHFHSLARPGMKGTQRAMCHDIQQWTQACRTCRVSKVHHHMKTPLQDIPAPTQRFHTVHIDIVGLHLASLGNRYHLTCEDRCTTEDRQRARPFPT